MNQPNLILLATLISGMAYPGSATMRPTSSMPYARTLDCSVSFIIPPGYIVMGVDKLNGKVANDWKKG